MVIDLEIDATQEAFGEMVGISQQTVSDLMARGVLVRDATSGEWLKSYCANLREMAAGRAASGGLDLATERARLAKEQADKVAMQNAVVRGELAPVVLIEEVLSKAASKVAGVFDAIPGMVRRRVPKLTSGDIDLIAGEIAKARNIVATMSLADVCTSPVESDEVIDDGQPDAQGGNFGGNSLHAD